MGCFNVGKIGMCVELGWLVFVEDLYGELDCIIGKVEYYKEIIQFF